MVDFRSDIMLTSNDRDRLHCPPMCVDDLGTRLGSKALLPTLQETLGVHKNITGSEEATADLGGW